MNTLIPGKQYFKCANKPSAKLRDLKGFDCPLWEINGDHKGSFNEASYKIAHVNGNSIALCPSCYIVKSNRDKNNSSESEYESSSKSEEENIFDCKITVLYPYTESKIACLRSDEQDELLDIDNNPHKTLFLLTHCHDDRKAYNNIYYEHTQHPHIWVYENLRWNVKNAKEVFNQIIDIQNKDLEMFLHFANSQNKANSTKHIKKYISKLKNSEKEMKKLRDIFLGLLYRYSPIIKETFYNTNSKEFIKNKYLTLKGSGNDDDLSSECSSSEEEITKKKNSL